MNKARGETDAQCGVCVPQSKGLREGFMEEGTSCVGLGG